MAHSGFSRIVLPTRTGRLALWEGGRGPALLLLHGANNEGALFVSVAPRLAAKYRVLIPDLPGHGESDPQAGPLTFAMMIQAVDAVIDYSHEKRITISGLSLGGWLTLVYAWRRPDRVARVFSVNGAPLREARGSWMRPPNREEARREISELFRGRKGAPPDFVIDDIARRFQQGTVPRLIGANPVDTERDLPDDCLREIMTPVDLIWGEADPVFPVASARRLESLLPASRLTIIPGCGHDLAMECAESLLHTFEGLMQQEPPRLKHQ
jgi:pimeloyl-ACP methyl ester carboxylesterase